MIDAHVIHMDKMPVGSKIKFVGEVQRYTVQASNAFLSVCNKPCNIHKTFLYTVIDWRGQIRATEGVVFGAGAETRKDCEAMLERLTQGNTFLSERNRGGLDIEEVKTPKEKGGFETHTL